MAPETTYSIIRYKLKPRENSPSDREESNFDNLPIILFFILINIGQY
jgi:hypothetical protein